MDPNGRDALSKPAQSLPCHHVEDAGKSTFGSFPVEVLRENLKRNPPLLPQSWDCTQKFSFHQRACIRLFKGSRPLGCGFRTGRRICPSNKSHCPGNGPSEDKDNADRASETRHLLKLLEKRPHFADSHQMISPDFDQPRVRWNYVGDGSRC